MLIYLSTFVLLIVRDGRNFELGVDVLVHHDIMAEVCEVSQAPKSG
jgi:hypothetical protein